MFATGPRRESSGSASFRSSSVYPAVTLCKRLWGPITLSCAHAHRTVSPVVTPSILTVSFSLNDGFDRLLRMSLRRLFLESDTRTTIRCRLMMDRTTWFSRELRGHSMTSQKCSVASTTIFNCQIWYLIEAISVGSEPRLTHDDIAMVFISSRKEFFDCSL